MSLRHALDPSVFALEVVIKVAALPPCERLDSSTFHECIYHLNLIPSTCF